MEEAWSKGIISAKDVYRSFGKRTAYTTLMTTLDRLYKKGLLERRRVGRPFLYEPRVSREEFEREIAEDVIADLLERGENGAEPFLSCIVDSVSEQDRELLDKLYRLVQEKRRELRRKE
jgi:predicted transcriptional regulator